MHKIGEFSILAKTTIKTLRYYEKERLLLKNNNTLKEILKARKQVVEDEMNEYKFQLSKINYLLEGESMNYEVVMKELPECVIYYKEGMTRDFSEVPEFILKSAEECRRTNPDIKCIEPDYCYMNYLDGQYKDKDIKIRYAQAVQKAGIPNETIKFEKLKAVDAVCIYHKGAYSNLGEAYGFIMKYIEENGYEIIDFPRERYIDGIWNKENVEDWLTEIQVPVRK